MALLRQCDLMNGAPGSLTGAPDRGYDLPAPLPSSLSGISEGAAGTLDTLRIMERLARQFKTDSVIRQMAERIISDVPEKEYGLEAAAIHNWVRDNVRYTQDVEGVETIKTPLNTLQSGQGDCDDKSLLFATLVLSIGLPARFVALGFVPGQFEHVISEVKLGTVWVASDTTERQPFGWTPPGMPARMPRHI